MRSQLGAYALSVFDVRRYYCEAPLDVSEAWKLSRKHFRIETFNHMFVKLNRFKNRLNIRELRGYLIRYAPLHAYFSVLDWLFPERVGKKYKAKYAMPVGGEYVVDVDSYMAHKHHKHVPVGFWRTCLECVEASRNMTVQVCEMIEDYYSKIVIVFSGRGGSTSTF